MSSSKGTRPDRSSSKRRRLNKERAKLEKNLGGIKEMKELPGIVFVIDTRKETIAVAEAQRVGIPIVAVVDTNSNPEGIDYPIPGNDDAIRAINLFTSIIAQAVIEADNEIGLEVIESLQEDERTEPKPAEAAAAAVTPEEAPESVEETEEESAPEEETVPLAAVAESEPESESESGSESEEEDTPTYTAEDYSDYQPEEESDDGEQKTEEEAVAERSGYNEEDLYEQDEE